MCYDNLAWYEYEDTLREEFTVFERSVGEVEY